MKKRESSLKKKSGIADSDSIGFALMLAPFAILFILFTVLPVISSIVLSFFSYDMISLPKFNGVTNYMRMFTQDEIFPKALLNTLKFSVITGPVSYFISFLLGWLINELRPFARSALAFLFYAPSLAGGTVMIWQVAFSGDSYGYINSFLLSFGIITEPIVWLKNETYLMPIIIIVQLWQSMGVSFLANISGLQNISCDLYEAASIEPLAGAKVYNLALHVAYAAFQRSHADPKQLCGKHNRNYAGGLSE